MEVTIRLMLVIVVGIIVVLLSVMLIFNMGGDAMGGFTDLFDWIITMGPERR
jgi:hypothetical protein